MGCSASWWIQTLCVCFIPLENAAVQVTVRYSRLEVVQGEFVLLPCAFVTTSPLSRLNIIWTLAPFSNPEAPIQVIVYDHGQVIEDPSLTGRVGFADIPWTADIILNDTQISDAGIYRCMVNNPPEAGDPGIAELVLSVITPPSLPVCQWAGDVEVGGSVTLSCVVGSGTPTPEIQWAKLNPEEISLPVNMEGDLSGSVQIVNMTSATSGLYRCSATNPLGTQNCYVNLSVYSPSESSPGILQGVLLTLSMALVLLALLAVALWLHRTGPDGRWRDAKEQREEEEEEEECYNEIRYTPTLMKRSFV